MSLPGNNSRSIHIDKHLYRWTVSESEASSIAKIILQRVDGGKLIVEVVQEIKGMFWLYNQDGKAYIGPVTPNWVSLFGQMAMGIGWLPEKKSTFNVRFKDGMIRQKSKPSR